MAVVVVSASSTLQLMIEYYQEEEKNIYLSVFLFNKIIKQEKVIFISTVLPRLAVLGNEKQIYLGFIH